LSAGGVSSIGHLGGENTVEKHAVAASRCTKPSSDERLIVGPRGGVITTATLRDATGWDDLVRGLGLPGWFATDCGTRR
jgi:hypothetical protein